MQSRVRKVRRAMIEGGIGMSRFIGVRVAGCALALLVSVGLAGATFAQTSLPQTHQMPPARTFKVIYPFVAGASGDVLTRLVVDRIRPACRWRRSSRTVRARQGDSKNRTCPRLTRPANQIL